MINEDSSIIPKEYPISTFNLDANKIITEWTKRVREEVPTANELNENEITSGIHNFLFSFEELINPNLSAQEKEEALNRNITYCQQHGKMRAQIKFYTLDRVIEEYRILRSIISEMLRESTSFNEQVKKILFECIDIALTQAATEFAITRSLSQVKLKEAVSDKTNALEKLGIANVTIENLGTEKIAREHFVSTLSHDLRNPLSTARLSAQMIKRDPNILENINSHAERIITSIDRADKMIRDLLDANKIKNGHQLPLHKEMTDITELFSGIITNYKLMYGERIVFKPLKNILIDIDPQAIVRIVENLLNNAIKYGAQHEIITLALFDENSSVSFSVHNVGNPISKKDQNNIFKEYHRSESADSSNLSGWGIGLTLIQGMTKAHGGQVTVKSSKADGTTFTVYLPKTH